MKKTMWAAVAAMACVMGQAQAQVSVLGKKVSLGAGFDGAALARITAENAPQFKLPDATTPVGGCAALAGRYVKKSCSTGDTELAMLEILVNEATGALAILTRGPKSEFMGGSVYQLVGKTLGGGESSQETVNVHVGISSVVTCAATNLKVASEVALVAEDTASGQKGGWQGTVTTGYALSGTTLKLALEVASAGESQGIECTLERAK